MKYEFEIDDDSKDAFEEKADNVAEIRVYDNQRTDVTKNVTVELFLSENALLGLGTELIRLAHNFKDGKHMHLEPADQDQQVQKMGVFLTPQSSKLIICCNSGSPIDDYLL